MKWHTTHYKEIKWLIKYMSIKDKTLSIDWNVDTYLNIRISYKL